MRPLTDEFLELKHNMTFEEFRHSILIENRKTPQYKILNCWGVYDAYKWIRKHKWFNIGRPLTEKEFYAIVRAVGNELGIELLNGNSIVLPERMGEIIPMELRENSIITEDGKFLTTRAIDWDRTLRLWYEDDECYLNGLIVRHENESFIGFFYSKRKAKYKNQTYYQFKITSYIVRGLLLKRINKEVALPYRKRLIKLSEARIKNYEYLNNSSDFKYRRN